MTTPLLLRAAALGIASGSRSAAGLAAVAATSRRDDPDAAVATLGGRVGTAVSGLLAAGELVADKLPSAGSRLATPALVARLVFGGGAALLLARRHAAPVLLPTLVGVAGAAGGAYAGAQWRSLAHERFGSDRPGALVEDGVTAALAFYATRRSP